VCTKIQNSVVTSIRANLASTVWIAIAYLNPICKFLSQQFLNWIQKKLSFSNFRTEKFTTTLIKRMPKVKINKTSFLFLSFSFFFNFIYICFYYLIISLYFLIVKICLSVYKVSLSPPNDKSKFKSLTDLNLT
jgi:hypothetical protein